MMNPHVILPKVRDAWRPMKSETAQVQPPVVNYAQDTWDDADLGPVLTWLEDVLKARRGSPNMESPMMSDPMIAICDD